MIATASVVGEEEEEEDEAATAPGANTGAASKIVAMAATETEVRFGFVIYLMVPQSANQTNMQK